MNWRVAVLENWRYKLSALVLASVLWMAVSANERDSQRVTTRFDVEVRDTSWVLVEAPVEVQTSFEGKASDLLALRISSPELRVAVDSVPGPTLRLPLRSSQVRFDSNLEVRPTGVSPGAVELRFDRRARRRIRVEAKVQATAAPGYAVMRPFLVQPDSVTVSGAERELAAVRSVAPRPITLQGLQHTVTRELSLDPPAGVSGASLSPSSVLVTVEVDSLVERQLALPVRLRGPAAASAVLERDSVQVTLRGARRVVEDAATLLREAFVAVEEAPARPTALPVSVDLPGDAPIAATIRPGQLRVRPAARGADSPEGNGSAEGTGVASDPRGGVR